jgi:SAM-dependent methyltransferase
MDEYTETYFKTCKVKEGLILKTICPLWWRWIKIIRKYKPKGCLFDAGCGEGYFLEYAEKYYNAHGMDVSKYGIRKARYRLSKSIVLVGSIEHIGYERESFDMITCFDVLEHLERPEEAIKECRRVLKKRGIFVVRVPNISSIGCRYKKDKWFAYRDKTHASILSNEQWFTVFQKNNFEILDIFYDCLWDSPYLDYIPKTFQDAVIKFPSLMLFLAGMRFSRPFGENLCMILRRE